MVQIEICIGSACYVKGANQVVNDLMEMIRENHWEDKVNLKGAFCMKACEQHAGLGIRINGEALTGVTVADAKERVQQRLIEELA